MGAFCDFQFQRHEPTDGDGEPEAGHCNMRYGHDEPHRCCCGWEEPVKGGGVMELDEDALTKATTAAEAVIIEVMAGKLGRSEMSREASRAAISTYNEIMEAKA